MDDGNDDEYFDRVDEAIQARSSKKKRVKPLAQTYQANNDGGFGNPPVKAQFAMGNAGGPGRPKGSSSLAGAMGRMFGSRVPLRDANKTISMNEAIANRAKHHNLRGSVDAWKMGAELALKYQEGEPELQLDFSMLSEDEFVVFGLLFNRLLQQPPDRHEPSVLGMLPLTGEGLYCESLRSDGHLHLQKTDD